MPQRHEDTKSHEETPKFHEEGHSWRLRVFVAFLQQLKIAPLQKKETNEHRIASKTTCA